MCPHGLDPMTCVKCGWRWLSAAVRRFGRWLRDQWIMDELPAWRDDTLTDTADTLDAEHAARLRHAAHRVERALYAQAGREPACRNPELVDFLLDMRETLRPRPAGSELLHEPTPVLRPAIPVQRVGEV